MQDEPVRLMHYDPRWRQEFEQTRSSILFSCEGWVTAVEHIGSTAISGLIARPTIDVIAIVQSRGAMSPAGMLIEGLNFRVESTPLWADGAITLIKPRIPTPSGPEPTHRVFLVEPDSGLVARATRLRDYLRNDPDLAIRFEEVKVASWRECGGDLQKYDRDKSVFIMRLEDQIDAAGGPDDSGRAS